MLANLLMAFLAGLILNVMPCVLPVIGLKLMGFAQQAGEDRRQVLSLNLWFTAGLMSVFMTLACLSAFLGWGWGEQFQRPEFGMALAAIVFAFALSMFGIWEVPIPGFAGSSTAIELSQREGPAGAFTKGVLATVLATPCSGPFLIPALTWALSQPTMTIFASFFAMGLGMASPYLLLGAFPGLIKWLPKPGAWMETFKHIMAFVLLATVVWIFTFIPTEWFVFTLVLLLVISIGCYHIGSTDRKLLAWVCTVGLVASTVFIGTRQVLPNTGWEPYSAGRLAAARQEGPVVVDFTADW